MGVNYDPKLEVNRMDTTVTMVGMMQVRTKRCETK